MHVGNDVTAPALVLTIEEAALALHCKRNRIFELLSDGVLTRAPKYGKRTLITAASVHAALEYVPPTAPKPKRIRNRRVGFAASINEVLKSISYE